MAFETPDDVFSPTMRKRSMPDPYGLDVDQSQDSILSGGSSVNNAYRPTLTRNGETSATTTIGGMQPAQNPYAARLEDVGNRLESAYAAPHAGTARQLIGAFLSRRNPALGGIISGETQRQRQIEPLQQEYGLLSDIINRNFAQQKMGADVYKNYAEGNKFSAEASAIPTKQKLEEAQTEAANYKEDPNLGLIDLRTKQPISPSNLAPLTDQEAQVLGKQAGDRVPLKLKNTANEIVNRGYASVNTEEGVFERNRGTSTGAIPTMTRLGANPRMVFSPENRIVPGAADPDNPGNLTYMRAGEAMRTGAQAPGSSPVQAAKGVQKSATSGKIGEEINAFNTALQHADLLKQAASALGNGDMRTLNSLKNRFQTEFGSPDVTNFQAIANAYSREITKMLSSGHLTDAEIATQGGTLPANASPQQIMGVIDNYRALAASKMQMRKNQVEKGLKGEANFPATTPASSGGSFKPF